MAKQSERDYGRLGRYIAAARRAHFGTVTAAVQAAGINRATWEKAERGERVREDRLTAIEKTLGWDVGDGYVIAEGGEPWSQSRGPAVTTGQGAASDLSDEELLAELQRRLARASGAGHSAVS